MDKLRNIWNELTAHYTDNTELIDERWVEIEKRYSEKKRYYHNLTHLTYMTEKAMHYKDRLTDPDTVLFSIFYHDIIYNPRRQNNEQKSAEFAKNRLTRLGLPSDQIARCQHQITATAHQTTAVYDDSDTNYLVDFDLAILGESREVYEDYARKIRKEYAIYPAFLYKKGRKKVLHYFLAMDSIFKTKEFHAQYEQRARENLKAELQGL